MQAFTTPVRKNGFRLLCALAILALGIVTTAPFRSHQTYAAKPSTSVALQSGACTDLSFNESPLINIGAVPKALVTGDFNDDGKPDLAFISQGSTKVSILIANGAGGFEPYDSIEIGEELYSIAVGYINKDRRLDLMVGAYSSGIVILFAKETKGYTISNPISNGGVKLSVGDFDADGNSDLIVNTGSEGKIFYGDGEGNFPRTGSTGRLVGREDFLNTIIAGDFNRDGRSDIIADHQSYIDILLQDRDAKFTISDTISPNFPYPSSIGTIAAIDANQDGNQDIILTEGVKVRTYLGNGRGKFGSPANFSAGPLPTAIAAADFNQDGKSDIAVANYDSKDIRILFNTCKPNNNTPPVIIPAPGPITRQQGGPSSISLIAAVSDAETLAGDLTVTTDSVPAGIVVTGIFNVQGAVSATILANCAATVGANTIKFKVRDTGGLETNTSITINVTENTPPTLGKYPMSILGVGETRIIPPTSRPMDNGLIDSLTLLSTNIVSGLDIDKTSGEITVVNAGPPGDHTVTVTAKDNCGASASTNFILSIVEPPDLQASFVNPPIDVTAKVDFTLTWVDRNEGKGKTRSPWVDRIYFSKNNLLDGDLLLVETRVNQSLDPGQQWQQSQTVKIPVSAVSNDGRYFIILVTDFENSVYEGKKEDNNITAQPVNVRLDNTPPVITDLKVAEIGKYSARVGWKTDEPATGIVQYSVGDSQFTVESSKQALSNQQSVVISPLTSDTLYRVKVKSQDKVGNESESQILTFTTEKRFDLALTGMTFSDDGPPSGESISISAKVKNLGDGATTATLVFYDSVQLGSGAEVYRKTIVLPALSPEQTITSPLFPVFQGRHFPYVQLIDISPSDEKAENNRISKDLNVAAPANRFAIGVSYPRTWPRNVGLFTAIVTNTGSRPQPITSVEITGVPWITFISKLPSEPVKPGEDIQLTLRMTPPSTETGGPVERPVRKPLTLKVTNSQSFTQDFAVDIFEGPLANLRLKVVDAITNEPIKGASLALNNSEVIWKTGDDGKPADDQGRPAAVGTASISNMVSAVAPGYSPNTVNIGLLGGGSQLVGFGILQSAANPSQTEVILPLVKGGLTITDITVRELTLKEIQDRGVKINDEKNNWIFDFELHLPIGEIIRVPNVEGPKNPKGGDYLVWGGAGPAGNGGPGNYGVSGRREYITPTQYRDTVIVIAGDVRFLKQFWDVTVFVKNSTNADIPDATVEIDVPQESEEATSQNGLIDGLKLPATNQENKRVVSLGTVKAQTEVSKNWTIRGDKAGEYKITGAIKFKEVLITKLTSTSFKVAEPKLKVAFTVPTLVKEGDAFEITIFVTNDSSVPLNYVRANIDVARLRNCDLADQATKEYGDQPLGVGKTWEVKFKFISHLTGCVLSATAIGKFPGGQFEIPSIQVTPCGVENVGPVAAFSGPTVDGKNVVSPSFLQSGQLTSESYDPDDGLSPIGIVSYKWTVTKPDGKKVEGSGNLIKLNFDQLGTYQATLAVVDNEGMADSSTRTFNVIQKQLLIFLPGAMGSVLRDEVTREDNWITSSTSNLKRLSLKPGDNFKVKPVDIIRGYPDNWFFYLTDVYGPLEQYLLNSGFVENKELFDDCGASLSEAEKQSQSILFLFPFDFRRSNSTSAEKLDEFVECVRAKFPDHKIDLLAHSQGGLVARQYIIRLISTQRSDRHIRNLITMGTPWLGAPKAVNLFENGKFFDFALDNFIVNNEVIRDLVPYFPGAHELLPGRYYFDIGGRPLTKINSNDVQQNYNFPEYQDFLNEHYPPQNIGSAANNFHSELQDDWRIDPTNVNYYHIVGQLGYGKTIVGNIVFPKWACRIGASLFCTDRAYKLEQVYGEGDGTVPLISARRKNGYVPPN